MVITSWVYERPKLVALFAQLHHVRIEVLSFMYGIFV